MKTKYFLIILFLIGIKPMFAQGDQFIAEIKIFAGSFTPTGWARCEGQLLPINQNTALFSLLGITYGGNGQTNFALPDLRERIPLQPGQGPGLAIYDLGEQSGTNTVTLTTANLPAHSHNVPVKVSSSPATTAVPSATASLAAAKNTFNSVTNPILKYTTAAANVALPVTATSTTNGVSTAVNTTQPYLVSNYIIALQGIYPPRP